MDDYDHLLTLETPVERATHPVEEFMKFAKSIRRLPPEQMVEKLALSLKELRSEAGKVAEPTEAQKDSGNYQKGHVSWKGVDITIETAKGQVRKGKGYEQLMADHYGYVKDTKGADGDHVDVFLCEEDLDSEIVFVVNQRKKEGGFDEHKCVLGCKSLEQAKRVYLRNYTRGWQGLESIAPVTLDWWKWWLKKGNKKEPLESFDAYAEKHYKKAEDPAEEGTLKSAFERDVPRLLVVKRARDEKAPFTIAVDLDGTLAEKEEPFSSKSIGSPRERAVHWVRLFHKAGARIIIFTVRGDTKLVEAWLEENEVPYDYVNENPDQPNDSSGKVIADAYWDNRAFNAEDPDEFGPEILRRLLDEGESPEKKEPAVNVTISHTTIILTAPELLDAMECDDGSEE